MRERDVIYDWNVEGHAISRPMRRVEVHDETLRDGIQCPSVRDPDIERKYTIVRLLEQVGVDTIDVGLPGAGPRAVEDSRRIIQMIRDEKLNIRPACAGRTHPNDIRPIIELAEQIGVPIEVMMFLGSSPIRMYAEGWDDARLESLTRSAVKMTKDAGIPATFVTEDTTRSHPRTLRRLLTAAVEEGATRLVLCDTVGHTTPNGVFNLVHWVQDLLVGLGVRDAVKIDWHGHNDRGHALPNTLYAIEAGCDRVHGTVLGIGERVGNTALDQILVNMKLIGVEKHDLQALTSLVQEVSSACDVPIPYNYPVFGVDAFRTGTGVHAAAVIKAYRKGDNWLSDRVYSGVPASWFGRKQEIEIGHQSGESNIRHWLTARGLPDTDDLVREIFQRAKTGNALLPEPVIFAIVDRWRSANAH